MKDLWVSLSRGTRHSPMLDQGPPFDLFLCHTAYVVFFFFLKSQLNIDTTIITLSIDLGKSIRCLQITPSQFPRTQRDTFTLSVLSVSTVRVFSVQ